MGKQSDAAAVRTVNIKIADRMTIAVIGAVKRYFTVADGFPALAEAEIAR